MAGLIPNQIITKAFVHLRALVFKLGREMGKSLITAIWGIFIATIFGLIDITHDSIGILHGK